MNNHKKSNNVLLAVSKVVLAFILLIQMPLSLSGADHVIKLTTLAPKGSSYHMALQRMGEAWRKASSGSVELIIYPGGIQGGEAAMVDRMRINQCQAGFLTAVGLAEIEKGVTGLQDIPLFFRDLNEVDYVTEKLGPMLSKRMWNKGFVVLFWSDTGWVRYFSKEPMITPDDLRSMKVFVWSGGNNKTADLLKSVGCNPVSIETGDIITALGTGMIDVLSVPPFYALATQMYTTAPHMLELNWAPLVGALVINRDAWEAIPFNIKTELKKAALVAADEIKEAGRRESSESVETMKKKWGLQVHSIDSSVKNLWRKEVSTVYPQIRGGMVPAEIFDEVERLLSEYRSNL